MWIPGMLRVEITELNDCLTTFLHSLQLTEASVSNQKDLESVLNAIILTFYTNQRLLQM